MKKLVIIGRPNVGKSTLFNALTKAGAYAADQLFATLDTTSRVVSVDQILVQSVTYTIASVDIPFSYQRKRREVRIKDEAFAAWATW